MSTLADTIAAVFTARPDILDDPYPHCRRLLGAGAIHWLPADAGPGPWSDAWHILGYDEVRAALEDPRLGAHTLPPPAPGAGAMNDLARIFGSTLLYLEPPDHTRLRRLTAQTFTKRNGAALDSFVQSQVEQLIDRIVLTAGTFDLVSTLAAPLPNLVVAELLGLPTGRRAEFAQRTGGLMALRPTPEAMTDIVQSVALIRDLLPLRRSTPDDDLLSDLLRHQARDPSITDDEVVAQALTVVIAGTETLTAAITTAVRTVLTEPAMWQALGPDTIDSTVDELLRYDGPTHLLPRQAHAPLTLGTNTIRPGQRVWLWLAATNRDPSRFHDPDDLDCARTGPRPLTFGRGIHTCIGSKLARSEIAAVLLALRARFPDLRLARERTTWAPNPAVRSPARLDLTTEPVQRRRNATPGSCHTG